MTFILLDLFYYYDSATNFPEFLKPEPLVLKNPIVHKLYLSQERVNQISKSITRLFLQDYIDQSYYYLYEDVTEEVTRNFKYNDNKGNIVRFLVPSESGQHNPFLLTTNIMEKIHSYLLEPELSDFTTILSVFSNEYTFCKLYWFLKTYENNNTFPNNYFREFKNSINSLNSVNNSFIKTLELLLLKRIITKVFNKNIVVE